MKTIKHIALLSLLSLSLWSCNKEGDPSNSDPAPIDPFTIPISCGLFDGELKVGVTSMQFSRDSAYLTNDQFVSEHEVNPGNGIIIYSGQEEAPRAGFYSITNNVLSLTPENQLIYIRYFKDGEAFTAQNGRLEIRQNGALKNALACELHCSNTSSTNYTISFVSIFN